MRAGRLTYFSALIVAMAGLVAVPAPARAARDAVEAALAKRLFPLFNAMADKPGAAAALAAKGDVAAVLRQRAARRTACGADSTCLAQAMVWTEAEVAAVAHAVPDDAPAADDGNAAQAARELEGVNVILRTYALGQVPRYPQIDGAGLVDPQELRARVQAAAWLTEPAQGRTATDIDPSIDFALALLDGSDRNDAIGFEPLAGGINAAAMARARRLDWGRYRYSAMIVTGVGPETPDMPLSAFGKYHLRLAANRFAAGDVPFIIVSGGRAHPRATRFVEAVEMRRALIERYRIPADAIVIEPYARHTTTNLRNAARVMMAMSAPLNRGALIVCNSQQSAAIADPKFVARNEAELGYQPGRVGRRVSPTELEFRPSPLSARIDPRDPLDP